MPYNNYEDDRLWLAGTRYSVERDMMHRLEIHDTWWSRPPDWSMMCRGDKISHHTNLCFFTYNRITSYFKQIRLVQCIEEKGFLYKCWQSQAWVVLLSPAGSLVTCKPGKAEHETATSPFRCWVNLEWQTRHLWPVPILIHGRRHLGRRYKKIRHFYFPAAATRSLREARAQHLSKIVG